MQVDSRAVEIAQDLSEVKKKVIRIFARDGVIDDEEFDALNGLNGVELDLNEKGEDESLAASLYKLGRHAQRVQRLSKQILPIYDEAS